MLQKQRYFWIFVVAVFLALFYFIRLNRVKITPPPKPTPVEITSILISEPKIYGQSQTLNLGQIKIHTQRYPEYHYGDKLRITGFLTQDLAMKFPVVEKLEENKGNFLQTTLLRFRQHLSQSLDKLLPEPQVSLLKGILLGIDKGMPQDFLNSLRQTGTIHMVVVSGQNVTMVAGFFLSLAGLVSRKKALVLSFVGIFLYTLLAGAQPPVVRAAIMGTLAYSAQIFGRQNTSGWVLTLTAIFMLLVDPLLLFDLSFQLSFLATLGILFLNPVFLKFLAQVPNFLRQNLSITLSAQLLTMPLIVYNFGQFSLLSVLANLLVIETIPFIMSFGAVLAFLSVTLSFLGKLAALFIWPILTYFVWITEFLGKLPFASANGLTVPLFSIWAYYLILLGFLLWIYRRGFLKTKE